MLYGKILYSKFPHARITKIDTSRARALPGVRAVLTGDDVPEIKMGVYKDNRPLKAGKVCSYRDEVAAVAATDPQIAKEAVSLIEVIYEPLPAVFDPEAALQDNAPLVHEEHKSNVLRMPWKLHYGDVEAAKRRLHMSLKIASAPPGSPIVAWAPAAPSLNLIRPITLRFTPIPKFRP